MNAPRLFLTPCFALLFACSSDDAADTGNDDGGTATDSAETAPTTEPADSSGAGDDSAALMCAADLPEDAQDGTMPGLMAEWGSACVTDADCVAKVGAGGICLRDAVIYELPLGYCSKPCDLPPGVTVVPDDPTCSADGGVACLGVDGTFEYCTVPCTDNAQCERAGYYCRLMPQIAMQTDPKFCLMPDCCDTDCSE